MRTLSFPSLTIALLMAFLLSLPVQTVYGRNDGLQGTRAEGEDMTLVMNLTFSDPLHYSVEVITEAYVTYFRGSLHNATSLRAILSAQGAGAKSELSAVLLEKVMGLANLSFTGDTITVGQHGLVEDSLVGQSGDRTPIVHRASLMGAVGVERFISPTKASKIDPAHRNELICAFLLSGFRFQRLLTLRSEPGITTTYLFPTSIDPYRDGSLSLNLRNTRSPPTGNMNKLMVDGRVGIVNAPFDLQLTGSPSVRFSEESIRGTTILDWSSLTAMDLRTELEVRSISADRFDLDQAIPPSVMGPGLLGAGLMRLSILDGLIDQEMISDIDGSISDGLLGTLETATGQDIEGLEVSLDAGTSGMPHPKSGGGLLSLLRSDDPLRITVEPIGHIDVDMPGGYRHDQVMGLLNGGLRIIKEFEPLDDDMTALEIVMPSGLTFDGEAPDNINADGRHVFDYEPGLRSISSLSAPKYVSEMFSVDATIDLSDVRSDYFLDAKVMVRCDMEIDLSRMVFDPDKIELNTTMDYELDHLSSDLVRLLLDMGVIDRESLEERMSDEISELLSPFLEGDDQRVTIEIKDSDLMFDGDLSNVDDSVPLHVKAHAEGMADPLGTASSDEGSQGTGNVFVKGHWGPLVPFKTVKRTISMEQASRWDANIKVIFPSGCGVRAWLGNGSQVLDGELEVKVEGAYPTIYIEGGKGDWDRLHLELRMSGWFGFNNVLACFATTIGALVLILLVLLVSILRKVRNVRKRSKGSVTDDDGPDRSDGRNTAYMTKPNAGTHLQMERDATMARSRYR